MAKRLLAKGGDKREFPSDVVAEIAIEHLGWVEIIPPVKPEELSRKITPPDAKPIKIIEPVVIEPQKESEPVSPVEKKDEVSVVKENLTTENKEVKKKSRAKK